MFKNVNRSENDYDIGCGSASFASSGFFNWIGLKSRHLHLAGRFFGVDKGREPESDIQINYNCWYLLYWI